MFEPPTADRLGAVSPQASVRDAAATMAVLDRRTLPVVKDGRLLGVIDFSDMSQRVSVERLNVSNLSVGEMMTTKVTVLAEDSPEFDPERLARQGIEYVLVLDASARPKDLTFVGGRGPRRAEDNGGEESDQLPPGPHGDDFFDELLELARTCRTSRRTPDTDGKGARI
ncbi:MAG: hypothetical protein AMXMBFR13_40920 [Phycisphaerae bacterium]